MLFCLNIFSLGEVCGVVVLMVFYFGFCVGLFPVGFVVINEETNDIWNYFFQHLRVAIGCGREVVFLSDHNHGILKVVRIVFLSSLHAYCYNHLKANLEYRCRALGKKVRGMLLKIFQKCAYATTSQQFEVYMDKLLRLGIQG